MLCSMHLNLKDALFLLMKLKKLKELDKNKNQFFLFLLWVRSILVLCLPPEQKKGVRFPPRPYSVQRGELTKFILPNFSPRPFLFLIFKLKIYKSISFK